MATRAGLIRRIRRTSRSTSSRVAAVGARLGTKSIQVVDGNECVLRVVVEVLRYFGGETASQCPPCYRGLPEMADLLDKVEAGEANGAIVDDFRTFMEAFPAAASVRCRTVRPSIALSYLRNFAGRISNGT